MPNLFGFELVHYKNFPVWDHQWVYTVGINNGLAIIPNENLITNIGMESGASHMTQLDKERSLPTKELKFPLKHPPFIVHDKESDQRFFKWMLKQKIRNFFLRKTGLIRLFKFKEKGKNNNHFFFNI